MVYNNKDMIAAYSSGLPLMTFGNWLKLKRAELRLSGVELEKRSGVSRQYISNLERDLLQEKSQKPIQPSLEIVDKIAAGLGVDQDEARLAAGYAPSYATKPRSVGELLTRLEKLGLQHLEFDTEPSNFSPEQLQEVYDAITIAIELTLRKKR